MNDRRPIRTALLVLAVHNLVQNSLLNERGYVSGNLVVSGLLLGVGRSAGLRWDEMGLRPGDVGRSVRIGARVAVATAAMAVFALGNPRTRAFLADDRATVVSGAAAIWRRALLRFPIGTALFEELAFRGVLPALIGQNHRSGLADLLAAACFGMWHLIPAGRALSGNPLGLGMPTARRGLVIVGSSVAGAASALALAGTRRATGSILAPWLIHAAFNSVSYLAGVIAVGLPDAAQARVGRSPSAP